ncbi:GntR family transcriptional regulator [Brevibacillus sp. H7]|uniref:GntR family transcriptional regulator n=1 Tax=Brevibacillus sp. H7 TaxID=3349138 RepID=UPI0038291753
MLDRKSFIPMYQQISETIQKQIQEGVYTEGAKIPTEQELMELFNVSRTTVRLAIQDMTEKGLIEKKQGKGTFVRNTTIYHPTQGFKGVYETLVAAGMSHETKLIGYKIEEANESTREVFQLQKGEKVKTILRLCFVDGKPAVLAQINLNPSVMDFVTIEEAEQNPIHLILENKLNVPIRQVHLEIFAECASAEIAQALSIQENSAVLGAERVLYTKDGTPVEHTMLWFTAEGHRFSFDVFNDNNLQLDLSWRG